MKNFSQSLVKDRKKKWIPIFILWIVFGLFSIFNVYEFSIYSPGIKGFTRSFTFLTSLRILSYWLIWAAFVPLISWLTNRFQLEKPQRIKGLLINLTAGIAISYLHHPIYSLLKSFWAVLFKGFYSQTMNLDIPRLTIFPIPVALDNFIIYIFIFLFIAFFNYFNRYTSQQLKTSRLEAQLVRAQLDTLKMQMQPHFLFNTLNSIAGIIEEDTHTAQQMICCLGDLLRISMEGSKAQEVDLKKELDFVRCYLEIEKMRYGDRLQVRIDADDEVLGAKVPPLILQPIVENAVRHGIAKKNSQGRIEVAVKKERDNLIIQVKDNGPGIDCGHEELFQRGMGLANTKKRMGFLYGEHFDFQIKSAEGKGMLVNINIPFHRNIIVEPDTELE